MSKTCLLVAKLQVIQLLFLMISCFLSSFFLLEDMDKKSSKNIHKAEEVAYVFIVWLIGLESKWQYMLEAT